jgi:fatty acid desaturase
MPRSDLQRRAAAGVDWPTIAVTVAVYGGWLAITAWHALLPLPALVLLGGAIVGWQGSLQHETIHGHPTTRPWLNDMIGMPPLSLYLPYAIYRRSHLAHHGCGAITDPAADPESRYHAGRGMARRLAAVQATLVGQLLFGPPIVIGRFFAGEIVRMRRAPGAVARDWLPHLAGAALLLGWLGHVGLPIGTYLIAFVYPGIALTLLRSYAEHRADLETTAHAAIVERGGPFALLFLNNNLHVAHHERPGLPWYRLPAYHRAHRERFLAEGGRIYRGYGEVLRRFAFDPHDDLHHPAYRPDQTA